MSALPDPEIASPGCYFHLIYDIISSELPGWELYLKGSRLELHNVVTKRKVETDG